MIQAKLSDLSADSRLIQAAVEIIESGSCAVSKAIRAGMTTSTVIACERCDWSLLVLAPTRRILKETVTKAASSAVQVPGNSECPLIKREINETPLLAQLPLNLPNCKECNASEWCEVLEILRAENPRVMGLTYAKLEALMLSRGKTSKEILSKISKADVSMMDEAHVLSLPRSASVRASASLKIPDKYTVLKRIYQAWLNFCQSHVRTIQELMELAEKGHSGQHLARIVFNPCFLVWRELQKAWAQLRRIAIAHELPDDKILQLRDIITIMGSSQASIGYISEDEGESGSIYVSSGQGRAYRVIKEFLARYLHHAKVLFVSGTLFEPYDGYFSEMAGREIKNVIFPDFRRATEKLTLIPDKWTLTSGNFAEKLPAILEIIKAISEREKQPIYLLAPNSRKAKWLTQEISRLGLKDILVDYYRSDRSLGVERTERICIAIGMAEIPANACDALARGNNSEERWIDSRRLRRQAVDADTWQACNRVRDPDGIVESRVYFFGCRLNRVRQVATWGTNRQLDLKEIKEKEISDGKVIRTPVFEVQVDREIELPKIHGENKNQSRAERRSLGDLIKKIELYDDNIIINEKRHISSIHINREKVPKVMIYNIPSDENEIDFTSKSLYLMFANRTDCYAQQYKNSKSGRWEFCKVLSPLTKEIFRKHVAGDITIGSYQIGLDDHVIWCCDDIDSHNGETDSRDKVNRLVKVLRKYDIPFLLEASGSIDSYHIWIPLARTKTYNAYRFIRQINSEAKVDCECWPKQKGLSSQKGKYGNLVKLPICYHQKSGGRSAFLDADSFEPLEGPIFHPGLVHLLEIPDLSNSSSKGMPVAPKGIGSKSSSAKIKINELRFCMRRALEDKIPLTGTGGHLFRHAIACEGRAIGKTPESVAQLFQNQDDFNFSISLKKSREPWDYDYFPWSCNKIQDQCSSIVKSYCQSCPRRQAEGEKVEA